ncbi:unnamed protein product [Parnassius apollo]|uniref:(apollo) hypothetical protein n=1 Tax=Parnassius apollo TaxID=110799 RepID=A0A8S3W1C2_PARAO|nr:unnamed protein product [Parnassius apollo]
MGCGSSGQVIPSHDTCNDGPKAINGKSVGNGHHYDDDLPTVVLPETPVKPKPPLAFEIPLEEFQGNRGAAVTPPPHVQRLLQPPNADISLPDIEEKLAEAEQRRQSNSETNKRGSNTLTIPPEPGLCEDKNI